MVSSFERWWWSMPRCVFALSLSGKPTSAALWVWPREEQQRWKRLPVFLEIV